MPTNRAGTPQIDPAFFERLGRLIVHWAYVERLIGDLFTATLTAAGARQPIDPGSLLVVTQGVSQATLTDWTRTMIEARYTPPDEADELCGVLKEADELRAERNVLAHGLWGTDKSPPGTAMVQTTRLERRDMIRDRLITTADLDDLIERTVSLRNRLGAWLSSHGFRYSF